MEMYYFPCYFHTCTTTMNGHNTNWAHLNQKPKPPPLPCPLTPPPYFARAFFAFASVFASSQMALMAGLLITKA